MRVHWMPKACWERGVQVWMWWRRRARWGTRSRSTSYRVKRSRGCGRRRGERIGSRSVTYPFWCILQCKACTWLKLCTYVVTKFMCETFLLHTDTQQPTYVRIGLEKIPLFWRGELNDAPDMDPAPEASNHHQHDCKHLEGEGQGKEIKLLRRNVCMCVRVHVRTCASVWCLQKTYIHT